MELEVENILRDKGVTYRLIGLGHVARTMADVIEYAKAEIDPADICKTIILRGKKSGKAVAIMLKGDDKVDFKEAKRHFGEEMAIADVGQVKEASGSEPGAVCPFLLRVPLSVDRRVAESKTINCGSGDPLTGLEFRTEDLARAVTYEIVAVPRTIATDERDGKSAVVTKETVKNRKGQKLAVIVERADPQKGLAFVMHGLGGFKEQPHVQTIADAFGRRGYSVVRFDATNSLGESDGDFEDATFTNYYEDLVDVVGWASAQDWYQEPFVMAGHSLGGMSVALFAENFPDKVKAVAPISVVVSGGLSVEAHKQDDLDKFKEWERTGWLVSESRSKPGVTKRLKWSHIADRLKYDLLPGADKLIMPVLLVVGENDRVTPPEHQRILFGVLPGRKEMHVISGAPHTFRDKRHLDEIARIFDHWIGGIE